MCTRYPIINRVSELKVHIELTRFVQPEKIEIDANERAVNEKSQYCFFVCTTFDSFLNDFSVSFYIKTMNNSTTEREVSAMYYTQEQIDRANQADLISFLQSQGEQLTRAGNEYRWKRHDSLTIRGNKWSCIWMPRLISWIIWL